MRSWQWPESGPVRIGSEAHKRMFCRVLLDTHNPYKPAVIEWPALNDDELARITGLPIWDIAVQTEGNAGVRVMAYAHAVADPLLREALVMDGGEEQRHKVVLHNMVNAYGVKLAPEPPYPAPKDPEWGFMTTGFSECIDSFFAFGLFALAKQSGFFPPALVETFEPVMQEECRHILFFANWFDWHRRNLPWWRKPGFALKTLGVFLTIFKERLLTAKDVSGGENFTATGHKSMGIDATPGDLLALCLAENDRRFAGYDARLVRPVFAPRMARLALLFLKRSAPKK
ncbi:MAG: ferritin-like domain-containing protein [Alphaproteobacteria bacterium]|nr:ferritin-like domain-containing protein [Alphaproteobacteria bacterium]